MKQCQRIAGILLVVLTGGLALGAQKPLETRLFAVNSQPPPGTLAEMIAACDAVVIARPTGQTRLRDWGPDSLVETVYSFRIDETIKFSPVIPAVGDTIDIEVFGGQKELPSRIVRHQVSGYGAVRGNGRYLIFVKWVQNTAGERLVPCYSAAGIIDITGQRAKSLDDRFRRFNETDSATLVADVRSTHKQGRLGR